MVSKKGIADDVFFDTMSDIKIWTENYFDQSGKIGLEEINWIKLHIKGEIFKIGRLQYQIFKYYFGKKFEENGKTIKFGNPCLNIHIPRGEKLLQEQCKQSICAAKKFFAKHFPSMQTDIMICDSWLLSSCNKAFMSENSNIIKFAQMFKIVKEKEAATDAIFYIFKTRISQGMLLGNMKKYGYYYDLSKFEANTSLQKTAKEYIMNGGKLGTAQGVLKQN